LVYSLAVSHNNNYFFNKLNAAIKIILRKKLRVNQLTNFYVEKFVETKWNQMSLKVACNYDAA